MRIPEIYRITKHNQHHMFDTTHLISKPNPDEGAFLLPKQGKKDGKYFLCIVSSGMGWDHVSVSIPTERRTPTWEEMCYIKHVFFKDDEVVVQYHPAKSDYVNNHEYCLHLWRCQNVEFPTPHPIMVGIK